MPFKNVEIALRLQLAGFTAGLGAASAQVNAFGKQLSNDLGQAKSRDIEQIGKASLIAGGALLAGFGLAARATLDFDKTLSDLQAVSGATGDQMDTLRQQALDAGAATTFSASEAAAAQVELAKAGVSTADILDGALTGALSLAAAGNLDLATAATYSANAMTTFGLAGSDVEHIADVLAAAANKSAVDVADIGTALQQTGLVADQFGLTLDDTVGVLAAFGQAGLKGSDAGTSLKTMLQRLGAPTVTAANEMERLGIDMFDAAGNFIGAEAAAGQLKDALGGLTQEQRVAAMNTIFGADAVRAATIMYEEGAGGIGGWVTAVNEAGYAEEVAAQKTDNLAGDLEALGGAFETNLIKGGSLATGTLRDLTQGLTSTLTGFGELPGAAQAVGVGFAGLAGTGLTAVGVVGTMAPKVRELKGALDGMGTAGQFVSRNMGTMAGALGIAGVALAVMAYSAGEQAKAQANVAAIAQSYTDAILEQGDAIGRLTDQTTALELLEGGLGEALRDAGVDVEGFSRAIQDNAGDIDELRDTWYTFVTSGASSSEALEEALERTGLAGSELGDELMRLEEAGVPMVDLIDRVGELAQAHQDGAREAANQEAATEAVGDASEGAVGGVDALGGALDETQTETEEAKEALEAYIDQLRAASDPMFGMISALNANRDAQLDVVDATAELDRVRGDSESTAADVAAAERDLVDAHTAVAESGYDVWEAVATLNSALEQNPGLLDTVKTQLNQMEQQGLIPAGTTALVVAGQFDEAAARATALGETDPNVAVTETGTATAQQRLRATKEAAMTIPEARNTTVTAFDRASSVIFGIERARDRIDGTSASVSINIREVFSRVNDSIFGRWGFATEYAKGGIHEFATGGITPAHIAKGDRIRYAEPETGGEAFIPRLGEYNRSKSILEKAAGWYGLDVVAQGSMAASGGGGTVVYETHVHQMIDPEYGALNQLRVERHAKRAVNQALQGLTVTGI